MLERATLDVLARAAEIGLPEAAMVPAAAYDPFLRPLIKKRVRRAVATASARTQKNAGDHVLRLAFLSVHPASPFTFDTDDVRAVATAFDALAAPYLPPRPAPAPERGGGAYRAAAAEREASDLYVAPPRPKRKFWPVTTSLLVTTLLGALAIGGALAAPFFIPSPYERFTRTPFGTALGEPLTDLVANGSRTGDWELRAAARTKLTAKNVEKQIGKESAASLAHALDGLPEASSKAAESTDEAIAPLVVALNDLDRRLVDAHVPALIHSYASGSWGRRNVWLTSYFVEERAEVVIDAQAFRVAWGRRIDDLNLADSALYKGAQEDWAIVSLPHLDEELVQVLLAPLAYKRPMGPEEYTADDKSLRAALARRASDLVTNELITVTHVTREDAQGLESAISHRNDVLIGLAKSGYKISATSRIWLAPGLVHGLQRTKARGGYEAKLAGEALRMNDRMKLHAKPLLPSIAEIARIEEEQFLGRLAEEKRLEAASAARGTPTAHDDSVDEDDDRVVSDPGAPKLLYFAKQQRGRALASGELASLARERTTPKLALWLLVRRSLATDLGYADTGPTALILGELFGQLGLGTWKKLRVDDDFVRSATAALEMPSDRVRAAAAKAYEEVFARPAPAMKRTRLP